MEAQKFYNHVSSWIKSYHISEALDWLVKFVHSSQQPDDIKGKLLKEIEQKKASLKNAPVFGELNGETWLIDYQGHPRIFTTRFNAICKVAEMKTQGYYVELVAGNAFYRIRLIEPIKTTPNE